MRSVGGWVFFFISLPTLTINALITQVLAPGKLGIEGFAEFIQIFFITLPLCSAVVIIAVLLERGVLQGYGGLFAAAGIVGGCAAASRWLGAAVGPNPEAIVASQSDMSGPARAIDFIFKMLAGYIDQYGFWLYVSSFAVGLFLAYAFQRLVLDEG